MIVLLISNERNLMCLLPIWARISNWSITSSHQSRNDTFLEILSPYRWWWWCVWGHRYPAHGSCSHSHRCCVPLCAAAAAAAPPAAPHPPLPPPSPAAVRREPRPRAEEEVLPPDTHHLNTEYRHFSPRPAPVTLMKTEL